MSFIQQISRNKINVFYDKMSIYKEHGHTQSSKYVNNQRPMINKLMLH